MIVLNKVKLMLIKVKHMLFVCNAVVDDNKKKNMLIKKYKYY